jgi:hypothetical protein
VNGKLPWQGVRAYTNTEKFLKLTEKKLATIIDVLCDGLPPEFAQFLSYSRSLRFEERPQYEYLKNLFFTLHSKLEPVEYLFEWVTPLSLPKDQTEEIQS